MLDTERWNEIWQTLSKNKLRTALTAFGVGWGILMLIIMLGAGNGLETGAKSEFAGYASNSVYLWAQRTSMPYQGFDRGRRPQFNNEDISYLRENLPHLEHLAPRNQLGGWRGGNNVIYQDKAGAFSVNGDYPSIQHINYMDIKAGRFLNDLDIEQKRKVAVIGKRVREILFDGVDNFLGEFIQINGISFRVVGEFAPVNSGHRADEQEQTIFIPFTTFQESFNAQNKIGWWAMTCDESISASDFEKEVKEVLKQKHHVHPKDERAFGSFNAADRFTEMNMVFSGIGFLTWFVGTLTLVAGVIGISNIMLVSVKERTKEIGVRRAIGATPKSIVSQIIVETVTLTAIAGYAGLLLGILIVEAANKLMIQFKVEAEFFKNPQIDLTAVFIALGILIVCGALAGLIPAQRAVQIKAIDALRTE